MSLFGGGKLIPEATADGKEELSEGERKAGEEADAKLRFELTVKLCTVMVLVLKKHFEEQLGTRYKQWTAHSVAKTAQRLLKRSPRIPVFPPEWTGNTECRKFVKCNNYNGNSWYKEEDNLTEVNRGWRGGGDLSEIVLAQKIRATYHNALHHRLVITTERKHSKQARLDICHIVDLYLFEKDDFTLYSYAGGN